jgi:hypothetical protein
MFLQYLSAIVSVVAVGLLLNALRKSNTICKPIQKVCYSPDCITQNKKHIIELCYDSPFYAQCSACFERFVLISETAVKEMEISVIPKKIE